MSAPAFDAARFRQVLGHFPTGVTVITAATDDGPVGLAVGSFFSVSLDPPLVGFCAGQQSSSWPRIAAGGAFCVNILGSDQEDVSRVFAGKGDDKFAGLGYDAAPTTGAPRLSGTLGWIDCALDATHDAGDHTIAVGRVHDLGVAEEAGPLVFFRGGYSQITSH